MRGSYDGDPLIRREGDQVWPGFIIVEVASLPIGGDLGAEKRMWDWDYDCTLSLRLPFGRTPAKMGEK